MEKIKASISKLKHWLCICTFFRSYCFHIVFGDLNKQNPRYVWSASGASVSAPVFLNSNQCYCTYCHNMTHSTVLWIPYCTVVASCQMMKTKNFSVHFSFICTLSTYFPVGRLNPFVQEAKQSMGLKGRKIKPAKWQKLQASAKIV